MRYKKWILPEVDKELVSEIAEESGIFPLTAFIAVARGCCDSWDAEQYIADDSGFESPYSINGVDEAVRRIKLAIEQRERILIYGDYDCDGVTATALMCKYLKNAGADVCYFVPDREKDGYGISCEVIDRYAENGCTLVITVDNGVNAVEEASYLREIGVDLIITDHHLPQKELPDAVAVIDPHIEGNGCEFKDLAGVGVAFKLICALEDMPAEEMIYSFGDLAALGTIGDIMPLVSENRMIVKEGLKLINSRSNLGIRALLGTAGVTKHLGAGNVAFTLCPRINAAGRMDSAKNAVELLLSEDAESAVYYANMLESFNTARQTAEQSIFEAACEIIDSNGYAADNVIVVEGYGWHIGVIGIAASKIAEKYNKPCIVITQSEGKCVGSGRSISGFSLFEALKSCSELLVKYGGHELAAGLTVLEENIEHLRKKINEYAAGKPADFPSLKIDCRILKPEKVLSVEVAKEMKVFEPYGVGNPAPLFGIMGVCIDSVTPIGGGKHIKLRFSKDNTRFYGLLFNCTEREFAFAKGIKVDIAANLEVNTYNEKESLSIIIKDMRFSETDWNTAEEQLKAVIKFDCGRLTDKSEAKEITPERNDAAIIYKFLLNNPNMPVSRAENLLLQYLPAGKMVMGLRILCDVGLVTTYMADGTAVYNTDKSGRKADLNDSKTLKKLKTIAG